MVPFSSFFYFFFHKKPLPYAAPHTVLCSPMPIDFPDSLMAYDNRNRDPEAVSFRIPVLPAFYRFLHPKFQPAADTDRLSRHIACLLARQITYHLRQILRRAQMPHFSTKIQIGSKMIFKAAPAIVETIANLGLPSERITGFIACPNI